MDALLYAHARLDDLDLDAMSQWAEKGKKSALHTKQAISITFSTMVGHFLRDLDLDVANVYMAYPACLILVCSLEILLFSLYPG